MKTLVLCLVFGLLAALPLPAQKPADPAAAWDRIVALDAGPQVKFKTRGEARAGSIAHMAQQEKALRGFIAGYPADEHLFEARIRLARLLQIRAGFEGAEASRVEARKILDELYLTATGEQRAEVEFTRLAFDMRSLRPGDSSRRDQVLRDAKRFKADHPADRRLAALLAEVAGLYDREPEEKRALLLEAQGVAADPDLKARLGDDLKRLDFLGKPVPLRFEGRGGKTVDLADYRGKVVLLLFFANFSAPATEAVTQIQRAAREWPKGAVQILGVSLDAKPEELSALVQRESITWPVYFDGKGWGSPTVRSLGINRLPTAWLIDQTGNLRSLNALEGTTEQVRQLLRK